MKSFLAVIAGIVTGVFAKYGLESLLDKQYPMLAGMASRSRPERIAILQGLPGSAGFLLIALTGIAVFAAAFVTVKISRNLAQALIMALILMTFEILNLLLLPHPIWIAASLLIIYLPAAYLGGRLASPKIQLQKNEHRSDIGQPAQGQS